jgi:hypothetical protein|tara:strand:- start:1784 stop:2986 length:1203 start_codon:yes stop_codon:yes gene_type:complete
MPRIIKKTNTNKTGPINNRLQTTTSQMQLLHEISDGDSLFFELEPIEVLEVHIVSEFAEFPKTLDGQTDFSYIGGVRARFVHSQAGQNVSECFDFKPFNPNINMIPTIGEILIGTQYFGEYYYLSPGPLNLFGNPSQNLMHRASSGNIKGTLIPDGVDEKGNPLSDTLSYSNDDDISQEMGIDITQKSPANRLLPNEGDLIIEGRFENTIRLGSDITKVTGVEGENSGNILLNVGQTRLSADDPKKPVEEELDTDGSSVYLTTNQVLKFTPGHVSKLIPEPYDGKSVLINSDKIILNTKNSGDIGLFSNNNISLSSVAEVVTETPVTKLGAFDAKFSLVLGEELITLLEEIMKLITTGLIAPTGPVAVNPSGGIKLQSNIKQILGIESGKGGILSVNKTI